MADGLRIDVAGDGLLSALDHAASRLERPVDLMRLIGATMQENIALRFITKSDPNGQAWLPLAPSTLKRKKARGSLLELTGHGKSSLAYNATDDYVDVGFGEAYMGFHETGTRYMPRRQLLTDDFVSGTLGKQDQADILDDIASYLAGLGLS